MRKLVDEQSVVRHPPLRDLALVKGQEILRLEPRPLAPDRKQERAFVPFWMRNTNHRRFDDFGVGHRQVFEFDRRYPFASGLDDVLRAIRNLHITRSLSGIL
ncbi:hypothetical protein ACVMGC_005544 [Bradyrhizobium barranii subsp. barranii]|nr:hypothetical protein [Bradyrhizobium japonicum]MCP1962192.1 hypothetical protein [Bradyrhizobium japonicum]